MSETQTTFVNPRRATLERLQNQLDLQKQAETNNSPERRLLYDRLTTFVSTLLEGLQTSSEQTEEIVENLTKIFEECQNEKDQVISTQKDARRQLAKLMAESKVLYKNFNVLIKELKQKNDSSLAQILSEAKTGVLKDFVDGYRPFVDLEAKISKRLDDLENAERQHMHGQDVEMQEEKKAIDEVKEYLDNLEKALQQLKTADGYLEKISPMVRDAVRTVFLQEIYGDAEQGAQLSERLQAYLKNILGASPVLDLSAVDKQIKDVVIGVQQSFDKLAKFSIEQEVAKLKANDALNFNALKHLEDKKQQLEYSQLSLQANLNRFLENFYTKLVDQSLGHTHQSVGNVLKHVQDELQARIQRFDKDLQNVYASQHKEIFQAANDYLKQQLKDAFSTEAQAQLQSMFKSAQTSLESALEVKQNVVDDIQKKLSSALESHLQGVSQNETTFLIDLRSQLSKAVSSSKNETAVSLYNEILDKIDSIVKNPVVLKEALDGQKVIISNKIEQIVKDLVNEIETKDLSDAVESKKLNLVQEVVDAVKLGINDSKVTVSNLVEQVIQSAKDQQEKITAEGVQQAWADYMGKLRLSETGLLTSLKELQTLYSSNISKSKQDVDQVIQNYRLDVQSAIAQAVAAQVQQQRQSGESNDVFNYLQNVFRQYNTDIKNASDSFLDAKASVIVAEKRYEKTKDEIESLIRTIDVAKTSLKTASDLIQASDNKSMSDEVLISKATAAIENTSKAAQDSVQAVQSVVKAVESSSEAIKKASDAVQLTSDAVANSSAAVNDASVAVQNSASAVNQSAAVSEEYKVAIDSNTETLKTLSQVVDRNSTVLNAVQSEQFYLNDIIRTGQSYARFLTRLQENTVKTEQVLEMLLQIFAERSKAELGKRNSVRNGKPDFHPRQIVEDSSDDDSNEVTKAGHSEDEDQESIEIKKQKVPPGGQGPLFGNGLVGSGTIDINIPSSMRQLKNQLKQQIEMYEAGFEFFTQISTFLEKSVPFLEDELIVVKVNNLPQFTPCEENLVMKTPCMGLCLQGSQLGRELLLIGCLPQALFFLDVKQSSCRHTQVYGLLQFILMGISPVRIYVAKRKGRTFRFLPVASLLTRHGMSLQEGGLCIQSSDLPYFESMVDWLSGRSIFPLFLQKEAEAHMADVMKAYRKMFDQ